MPSFPEFPFLLPLLGAVGAIGLSLVRRLRPYAQYGALILASIAAGLTAILFLSPAWEQPVTIVPSLWQPSVLFGTSLLLESGVAVRPLAVVLALVTCSAAFVQLGRTHELSGGLLAAVLTALAAAFVALWSGNILTMVVGWAVYDLSQAAGRIAAGSSARTVARGLVFGVLAALLLWAGALVSVEGAVARPWSLMVLTDVQRTLWLMACILRLWVYPVHLSAPGDLGRAPALAAPLLLGPVLGWGLWLRLASLSGGAPDAAWVPGVAAIAVALSGFLAWTCEDARRSLSGIGGAVTGALLLAAFVAQEGAPIIVPGIMAWALGTALVFMTVGWRKHSPQWSIPALVGALALLGFPLTLGFVTGSFLVGRLVTGGHLWWGAAFFAGQLFLIPSLARILLSPASAHQPPHRLLRIVLGIGLGLPASLLAVAGVYAQLVVPRIVTPRLGVLFQMPGLAGWLLWVVSFAAGGLLAWQEDNLRPRTTLLLGVVHDLLLLEWLYDAVVGAVERGLSVLRVTDEIVGGAGALLWSFFLCLILLVIWGS